jgi:hypothetical protein
MRAIARQPPIAIKEGLLEAMFSVGSGPRLYIARTPGWQFSSVM